jgi:CubicO group peptidase (beta-lactamase class C family)
MAAAGSYFRTRDFAKFGQLMLNEGRWDGKQPLSKDWVRESTRKQTSEGQYNYGFYWHLSNGTPRHIDKFDGYEAIGQGDQFIAVFPKPRVVVVITSQNWVRSAGGREPENSINQYSFAATFSAAVVLSWKEEVGDQLPPGMPYNGVVAELQHIGSHCGRLCAATLREAPQADR